METMTTEIMPKLCPKFFCNFCNYRTSKKSSYSNHLQSKKHKNNTATTQDNANINNSIYECNLCYKEFNDRAGLWRHKKKCQIMPKLCSNKDNDKYLFIELLKQHKEFKELIIEQNKQLLEISKNNNVSNIINNTTNNNTHFNLNVFLNETCKNAMNISDFIDRIQVNLSDLENTGRLGYVEGISRIFIKGLQELEVNERPIHCSDAKRETLYIKDGDKWEKDDINKTKLTNAIRKIGHKNMRMITEWKKQHPHCNEYDSNKNDLFLKIVSNSMNGSTEEETENNYNKIRKNIIKEVIIIK
jgi:hypothetical protein